MTRHESGLPVRREMPDRAEPPAQPGVAMGVTGSVPQGMALPVPIGP
jgi:hypothetical protein